MKLLQAFCDDNLLGISIKDNVLEEPDYKEVYAEDFDYADGEEETNGSIFIYHKETHICTHIIHGEMQKIMNLLKKV